MTSWGVRGPGAAMAAALLLLVFSASAVAGPFAAVPESLLRAGAQFESLLAETRELTDSKLSRPQLTGAEQSAIPLAASVMSDLRHLKSINAALMNDFLFINSNPPEGTLEKMTALTLAYMKDVALPQCRSFRANADALAANTDPQFAFMGKKISQVFSRYIAFLEKGIDLLQAARR